MQRERIIKKSRICFLNGKCVVFKLVRNPVLCKVSTMLDERSEQLTTCFRCQIVYCVEILLALFLYSVKISPDFIKPTIYNIWSIEMCTDLKSTKLFQLIC